MIEMRVHGINLGFDAAVMYSYRSTSNGSWYGPNGYEEYSIGKRDYLDIPINLKWKIAIPGVEKIITPFVFTGPNFSFLLSRRFFNDVYNKEYDISWNLGAGVQLFRNLQIAASYGWGFTKSVRYEWFQYNEYTLNGRNQYWTITAAFLF